MVYSYNVILHKPNYIQQNGWLSQRQYWMNEARLKYVLHNFNFRNLKNKLNRNQDSCYIGERGEGQRMGVQANAASRVLMFFDLGSVYTSGFTLWKSVKYTLNLHTLCISRFRWERKRETYWIPDFRSSRNNHMIKIVI